MTTLFNTFIDKEKPSMFSINPWGKISLPVFIHNSFSTNKSAEFLPICGGNTRVKGYDLPEPFGVGVNYINR